MYLSFYISPSSIYPTHIFIFTDLATDFEGDLGNRRYFTIHNISERQVVRKFIHFLLGIPVHESCLLSLNSLGTVSLQEVLGDWRTSTLWIIVLRIISLKNSCMYFFHQAFPFLMTSLKHIIRSPSLATFPDII